MSNIVNDENKLNILLLNARSLRNKIDELKALINTEEYDVIGVTETWTKTSSTDFTTEFDISGYNKILKERINNKGGGVILYFRNSQNVEEIEVEQ